MIARPTVSAADFLTENLMDFDLAQAVAVLERTPGVLRALLAGLPPARTDATEGPDTWSPYIVVGHLIHGERADWMPRARIILAQGPDRRLTLLDREALQICSAPRREPRDARRMGADGS